MNTVQMNKINAATLPLLNIVKNAYQRSRCLLRGEKYEMDPGPQWQQLELPFSRTPIRKWNR